MLAAQPYAEFPIISCGVDYLTATSKRRGVQNGLEDFGKSLLRKAEAARGQIRAASRLGYAGFRTDTIFLGTRPGDCMLQVSGPQCTPLAEETIRLATNVSRIDLQVTVWTEGESANLAQWTYRKLCDRPRRGPQEGRLQLISGWPDGDTLSINRRVSESFGRLYDKTAEASLGPPRLVWRYEVEWKGKAARYLATRLGEYGVHPPLVNKLVHDWYTKKGVQPAFASTTHEYAFQPTVEDPSRDVLTWMRESLSKTITKATAKYGQRVVLEALGLAHLIEGDPNNGGPSTL